MSEEEKLHYYLQKLEILSKENIKTKNSSAIEVLKQALHYIEGEMKGY